MLTVNLLPVNNSVMDRRTQRLLDGWLGAHRAPNTQAAYRQDIIAFLGWCAATGRRPFQVTPADIGSYRDTCLADGARPATVARRLSGIASFFAFAAAAGAVERDPVDGVDRPSPPDPAASPVLDDGEMRAIIAAADAMGARVAALIGLVALDGLKIGDVLAIDVDDVRLDGAEASVILQRRGEAQEVTLSARTSRALAAYIADRHSGPLFLGDSAVAHEPARLTRFGADFIIKRAASVGGVDKPVSATLLRRSCIRHQDGGPDGRL